MSTIYYGTLWCSGRAEQVHKSGGCCLSYPSVKWHSDNLLLEQTCFRNFFAHCKISIEKMTLSVVYCPVNKALTRQGVAVWNTSHLLQTMDCRGGCATEQGFQQVWSVATIILLTANVLLSLSGMLFSHGQNFAYYKSNSGGTAYVVR